MSSFVVRSLVSAARGEVAAAAAAALGQLAAAVAFNDGALNLLRETREGIRAGRKSIASLTLAGLVLSALDTVESTYKEAGCGKGAKLERKDRERVADEWGQARAAALLSAVDEAKAARKAAADARAEKKGNEAPKVGTGEGSPEGNTQGNTQGDTVGIDAALIRCAAFSAESLADAIGANEAARAVLSQALALLVARDAAKAAGDAAAAEGAAAAAVAKAAKGARRVAKGAAAAADMVQGEKLAA